MLKLRIVFLSAAILMATFTLDCEASPDSEAAKGDLLMAEAFSDIGSLSLCLAQLSCDPKIARSIYVAIDRCVQRTRDIPREGISLEEYMNIKYKALLQTIKEMTSQHSLCKKIPFPCHNECAHRPLQAPQEVYAMGKVMTELAPVVECVLASNDSDKRHAMEAIILDVIKTVADSDPYDETSVSLVEKHIAHIVHSLRKMDEKCANVKAVNDMCF